MIFKINKIKIFKINKIKHFNKYNCLKYILDIIYLLSKLNIKMKVILYIKMTVSLVDSFTVTLINSVIKERI